MRKIGLGGLLTLSVAIPAVKRMTKRNLCIAPWVLAFLVLVGVPYLAAQDSDVTPPSLVEFDFNPKMIDVTAGPQSVTVTARVTDDLSGATFGFFLNFRSPTGNQFHQGFVFLIAGSELDGTYSGTVQIPQYVESGTWTAFVFSLGDSAGNQVSLSDTNLADAGFPTDLEVVSIPDTTPPTIADMTIAPPLIDVSSGDQIVTIDLRLTDDLSGLSSFHSLDVQSPSGQQRHFQAFSLISGTPTDSIWRANRSLPQYSEDGIWSINGVGVADRAGNRRFFSRADLTDMGFPTTFTVVSVPEDTMAPQLNGLTFIPSVIDTSAGPQNVNVSIDLSDDLAGVDFSLDGPFGGFVHSVLFTSPSGGQFRGACCSGFSLADGTILDGKWQANAFFPQFSEAGTWRASLIQISDRTHNWFNMDATQLENAGFPAGLVVVRPSLVVDDSVGPGGGTVEDETFGSQAQVTFPPGAVAEDTEVSIDVFESPLDVPTPAGFQGPGTNFVNISLDPEPSFPFPAPGVTLVLPLSGPEQLPVGFAIPLYFVDPDTGALTPMLDFSGSPVIGTVDDGGQTATFTGISHFTIVVGLIPDVIQVLLDIMPGTSVNPLNVKVRGTVPVAIISTESFNAVSAVNQNTLTFGKTGNEASLSRCDGKGEDVNRDGRRDLVCHFHIQLTGFAPGDTQGVLKGKTWANENIQGADSIRVVK